MISRFGEEVSISRDELRALVFQTLENCAAKVSKPWEKVLVLPPDHTRLNSQAGPITAIASRKWLRFGTAAARNELKASIRSIKGVIPSSITPAISST